MHRVFITKVLTIIISDGTKEHILHVFLDQKLLLLINSLSGLYIEFDCNAVTLEKPMYF